MGSNIATTSTSAGEMKALAQSIEQFVNTLPMEYDELVNCHDVHVRQVQHHIFRVMPLLDERRADDY